MNKVDESDTVGSWLTRHFLDWAKKDGERKTVREFAAYLGINEVFVGKWMRGERVPRNAYVIILANKFGDEIYDILDWPRPRGARG